MLSVSLNNFKTFFIHNVEVNQLQIVSYYNRQRFYKHNSDNNNNNNINIIITIIIIIIIIIIQVPFN